MRVMTIIKATAASEAGQMPSSELLDDMGKFNAELVAAGVLVAGDGLKPSKHGVRITFDPDGSTKVLDGPFAETKELVSGFWILEVADMDEAVAWIRRVPNTDGEHAQIEIRPIFGAEDFDMTPEQVEAEKQLFERAAEQHGG